nr:MAG TPA: hypothetical protein [Caudoviricetes sp.]
MFPTSSLTQRPPPLRGSRWSSEAPPLPVSRRRPPTAAAPRGALVGHGPG